MRFRGALSAISFVATVAATSSPAFCQTAPRGTLTGSVTDAQGRTLQGAQITVDPGGVSTVSDAQGLFTLTALLNGEYTVAIKYEGFATLTQTVTLGANQSIRIDAALKIATNKEDVQVYAGRQGGEIEAINRTFTADNIINVLPSDVITSLTNANVADAIGRLPSVTLERDEGEGKYVKVRGTEARLTHTTLDGVTIASPETVRQIKLDLIPADLVESVQINKTYRPIWKGTGSAGPWIYARRVQKMADCISGIDRGIYADYGGRPASRFDGTFGKRFLEGNKLGALVSGSYDWNGTAAFRHEPGPALAGKYDLRDYRYFRDRRGIGRRLTTVSMIRQRFTSRAFTRTSITSETTGFILLRITTFVSPYKAMVPDRFRSKLCADGQYRISEDFNLGDTMHSTIHSGWDL